MSTVAVPPVSRRRVRPYLVSLERSRARWKERATCARAEAHSLRRQLRRLTASCQRWRDQARHLRRQLQATQQELAKNCCRS